MLQELMDEQERRYRDTLRRLCEAKVPEKIRKRRSEGEGKKRSTSRNRLTAMSGPRAVKVSTVLLPRG